MPITRASMRSKPWTGESSGSQAGASSRCLRIVAVVLAAIGRYGILRKTCATTNESGLRKALGQHGCDRMIARETAGSYARLVLAARCPQRRA